MTIRLVDCGAEGNAGDGIRITGNGDVDLIRFQANRNGGSGININVCPLTSLVPKTDLLAALQAFQAAQPSSLEMATLALQPTGIERWLAAGSNLATFAAFLLANQPWVTSAILQLTQSS